jgi:response regulator of citrate/malate metabolism
MIKILLIDDDQIEYTLIKQMLLECLDHPFSIVYAATLESGISILKSDPVDVILLDNQLNNGVTAQNSLPQLRLESVSMPIVIISNTIDAAYLQDKVTLGVYDIVDKYHLREKIKNGLLLPFSASGVPASSHPSGQHVSRA